MTEVRTSKPLSRDAAEAADLAAVSAGGLRWPAKCTVVENFYFFIKNTLIRLEYPCCGLQLMPEGLPRDGIRSQCHNKEAREAHKKRLFS